MQEAADPVYVAGITETLYHWSNPRNRASIAERGLLVELDRSGAGAVFLDLEFEPGDAGDEYDIWAVDVRGLEIAVDDTDVNLRGDTWLMHRGSIGPDRLTLVHEGELFTEP